jgi:hypothetical protein
MLRLLGLAIVAAMMAACATDLSGEQYNVERTDGASGPTPQCKHVEITSGTSSKDGAVAASTSGQMQRCVKWSGREDLNLRPSAPKADALPG